MSVSTNISVFGFLHKYIGRYFYINIGKTKIIQTLKKYLNFFKKTLK